MIRREYDARGRLVDPTDALFEGAVEQGRRRMDQIARDHRAGRRPRPSTPSERRAVVVATETQNFIARHLRPPLGAERLVMLKAGGVATDGRRRVRRG